MGNIVGCFLASYIVTVVEYVHETQGAGVFHDWLDHHSELYG